MKRITRRQFIKVGSALIPFLFAKDLFASSRRSGRLLAQAKPGAAGNGVSAVSMAVVKGKDHRLLAEEAVNALGGIKKFVKKGDKVVVKPNMAWDRSPEQAGNTNPVIVSALVSMCLDAGAAKVKVFDRCCSDPRRTYKNSGIAAAAKKAGADVFHVDEWNYVKATFDYDSPLEGWPIYRDAVEADCFINVPVLKHHGLTKLTLSMKNLMGVMGDNRGRIHWGIDKKLAHVTDFISPDLTIIDATRVLTRNGPSGGNLEDVKVMDTVIASTDPVLADSEAARIAGRDPMDIGYIKEAHAMGLGKTGVPSSQVFRKDI